MSKARPRIARQVSIRKDVDAETLHAVFAAVEGLLQSFGEGEV